MVEVLAALGMGAKELFSYNRENFKFDQDQRIERESLRIEMQVKRFELFREDVRDLVELTVDRMDVYHLVGALFLEFCIVLFCEGRVQASAPPFLLSMFLLSNACAFIYLLLAVWLSMHASIASHSFGVRLLTRFVRLPIPSSKQIMGLRSHLKDYERQGVANLLKLPFVDKKVQDWDTDLHVKAAAKDGKGSASAAPLGVDDSPNTTPRKRTGGAYLQQPSGSPEPLQPNSTNAPRPVDPTSLRPRTLGRSASPSPQPSRLPSPPCASPRPEDERSGPRIAGNGDLLPEDAEDPFGGQVGGGQDLLEGRQGAMPERHVQLFRQLQSKWQCYDAYCRVCMGLGVNQILQGLSYYAICHTLVENHSPTTGYALVVLFQCTTIALAVLDLAGLKRREILAVQVVGVMPCAITAFGIAHGARDAEGKLDPDEEYKLSPLSFLFQVMWLELWLRVAAPSDDQAKLPRRFRQVLFLDVFGDAFGWDPTEAENDGDDISNPFPTGIGQLGEDQDDAEDHQSFDMAADQASSQLTVAQCAVRRWNAVPHWALSAAQKAELDAVSEQLSSWGNTISMELQRHAELIGRRESQNIFEPELRPWSALDPDEKESDPFGKCLMGPFEHDGDYENMTFHFDLETNRTLFEEAVTKECPGALVLSLEAVASITRDLERDARVLLEERIMRDLKQENIKRQRLAREREEERRKSRLSTAILRRGAEPSTSSRCVSAKGREDAPWTAALSSFPNLVSLFKKKAIRRDRNSGSSDDSRLGLIGNREETPPAQPIKGRSGILDDGPGLIPASNEADPPRAYSSTALPTSRANGQDPTLVAMAGKHARHFVPERLPWQVLSRMTRVLQICWFFTGVMALLKEAHVYQVDFQEHPGHERRRLCAVEAWQFERVDVEWPHGPLFRPHGLACSLDAASDGSDILMHSPFALYSATSSGSPVSEVIATADSGDDGLDSQSEMLPSRIDVQGPNPLRFIEEKRLRLRSSAALLCPTSNASAIRTAGTHTSACLLAEATDQGLEVRSLGSDQLNTDKVVLPIDGAPWRLVSGAIVPCATVAWMLPAAAAPKDRRLPESCIVVTGWDGEFIIVGAVPLVANSTSPMPAAGARVQPAFDVPLPLADVERGVVALHLASHRLRLWAVLSTGQIEAWDLLDSRSLGRWKPQWPPVSAGFRLAAICELTGSGSLLAIGRSDTVGPLLLRADLPRSLPDGGFAKGGFLRT